MPRPQRRPSSRLSGGQNKRSALTERLEDIVVFELTEDGNREYRTTTLRGLYNYVMKSITNRPSINATIDEYGVGKSILSLQRYTSDRDVHNSPIIRTGKAIPMTARARSGSVGSAYSTISPPLPPPPLSSDNGHTGRAIRSALINTGSVRTFRSAGQTPSARNVRFHPNSIRGNANQRQNEDGERNQGGEEDGEELDPNALVTFRERLGGYLHPRDMRRLVTPFSSSNEPELIVRRHVMLLNFDPLRAIVLRDRLLVLVPDGADSILISLERKLKGGIKELEKSVFGEDGRGPSNISVEESNASDLGASSGLSDTEGENNLDYENADTNVSGRDVHTRNEKGTMGKDAAPDDYHSKAEKEGSKDGDEGSRGTSSTSIGAEDEFEFEAEEWDEIDNRIYLDLPFELQAVDAVLSCVSSLLSGDAVELKHKVCIAMAALRGDSRKSTPGDHAQEKLRILKDGVGEMEARVQGFVRALNLVLDEDEDMALMNLSRLITHPERFIQPVSQEMLEEESDEPELILEAYMQQSLSTVNSLELLKGQIASTEELVTMKLDAIRNRLLYISTMVSIASLCVATASLVGSIFGMNLLNNLESDSDAFAQVLAGTLIGCVGLFLLISLAAYRSGVLPQGVL
mmetsp:Transcript_23077/g.50017  ORF Transcript_23077/g.50017 Transcript_23077/m.50017 type:complete len:632 (+) Transcript_23077:333-2228(+)